MKTNDPVVLRLRKKIASLHGDLVLLHANRSDAALGLETGKGDPEELKAQLDKAEANITECRAAIERAEGALVLQQSRDLEADQAAEESSRCEAAKDARVLMAESTKLAQQVDKAADTLVAALVRMNDTSRRISRLAYDVGMRGETRHNLLSIRHAGSVLAQRLIRSGLHDQLDSIDVSRPAFAADVYADLVKGNMERLDARIERALVEAKA